MNSVNRKGFIVMSQAPVFFSDKPNKSKRSTNEGTRSPHSVNPVSPELFMIISFCSS